MWHKYALIAHLQQHSTHQANTLFTLEDLYGLKITELDGEVCLHLDKGMGTNYITMFEMFTAWKEQAEKLKNGEISKEEYDNWRYNYPASNIHK